VVAQSPSGGVYAAAESHVTLNLSEGKGGAATNSVPSLMGRTIPEAVAAVKSAGLRLIFVRAPVSDRSQAGTVVEQTPAPGTQIPAHGEVLVFMGAAR
jgi:beta-lactam-binding protein with PASTA domain